MSDTREAELLQQLRAKDEQLQGREEEVTRLSLENNLLRQKLDAGLPAPVSRPTVVLGHLSVRNGEAGRPSLL